MNPSATTMQRSLILLLAVFMTATTALLAQLQVSIAVQNPTCAGFTNGSLLATASGGQEPYQYTWSDGASGQGRWSLSGGTFSVTVTDASGATASASATVVAPPALVLAINPSNGSVCDGAAAGYTLVASGGTAPYQYFMDGQPIGDRIAQPSPGYHYFTVTDANGCQSGNGVHVAGQLTVDVRTQNVVCHGYCDGTVEARISGGIGPFRFLWNTGDTTQLVYGLDPGTYTVVVTDAQGCQATGSGTLTEPAPITFNIDIETPCDSGSFVNVTASGGTGNLSIRYSTGDTGGRVYLPEGQHYVYIRDENGCEVSDVIILSSGIRSVTTMTVDATCDSLGRALICITGGRGPFTYIWSDGQTGIEAVNLAPGVYTFSFTDGAGCSFTGSTIINGPTPAECQNCDATAGSLTGGRVTEEACGDTIRLAATVSQAPNVPPGYQVLYVLTQGTGLTIVQVSTTPVFAVTQPGVYTIHTLVYDPNTLDLSGVVLGQTMAGSILLQLIQGGGDICAALDVNGTRFTVPQCSNPAGCVSGTAAALQTNPNCFDGDSADLSATVLTPPSIPAGNLHLYLLVRLPDGTVIATSQQPSFTVNATGEYEIRSLVYHPDSINLASILTLGTTTLAGLQAQLSECDQVGQQGARFTVAPFDPAFPSRLLDRPCPGETVVLNPDADLSYSYSWSPATGISDVNAASPSITINETTVFQVTITQVIGNQRCSVTRPYLVEVAPLPTLELQSNVLACGDEDVTLRATTSDSTTLIWASDPNFLNVLSQGDSLVVTANPTASTYYVRATNANGCVTEGQVSVSSSPIVIALGDDLTICRGEEASVDVEVVDGTLSSLLLLNEAGQVVDTASNLNFGFTPQASGIYRAVATNAAGCTDTVSIGINLSSVSTDLMVIGGLDSAIYPGASLDLGAISNGATSFQFNSDSSYISIADSSAVVAPRVTTTYTVTATNELGCTASASLTIQVLDFICDRPYLFVPNVFTPDGDGINDVFFVDGVNVDETYYAIYNRWGELVFESRELGNENGNGWHGTFRGQVVEPDVYGLYVRILCRDGEEFKTQGNVTVIR